MGCNCLYDPEEINKKLKEAIRSQNFLILHQCLVVSTPRVLDPSLIHEAVKTGHIDIIDVFIDFSIII